jgi:endonuclease YncB( thermonuclease family)
VSKHWTPRKQTVALEPARPSRIRRDPVRLESKAALRKTVVRTDEQEMLGGVTGVLLFAAAIAVIVIGVSIATIVRNDPAAAARAMRFGQCYNADGPNCVLDGATIRIRGEKSSIAGIDAPQIQGAKCAAERTQGIDAAVKLADLLNSGRVSASGASRDAAGREVRKVTVNGEDVGAAMIDAGAARKAGDEPASWC